MRIATFPDPQGAGLAVARAAIARGHELTLTRPDAAYVRTLNYGPWCALSLERIESLHRDGVPTIPSYEHAKLYDDKRAQLDVLRPWLPETLELDALTLYCDKMFNPSRLPFVSKAARGSASHNVRLVTTQEQANEEVRAAFAEGIPLHHGKQRGYLYWQELIRTDHDIRVVVNGENLYGLRRFIRSESEPFASGSGKREPITSLEDPHVRRSFELAKEITSALNMRWAAFDFIFDSARDRVYVLEVSFSWSEAAYAECPCFEWATLMHNDRMASEWATFAVEELERLHG